MLNSNYINQEKRKPRAILNEAAIIKFQGFILPATIFLNFKILTLSWSLETSPSSTYN